MDIEEIQKEKRMSKYSYEELEQQKMRDDAILKLLAEANESGEICKYSEEQILAAQQQNAKNKINNLYNELIFPITNNILYLIYSLATLIIMPFIYAGGESGAELGAVAAYFLVFSVAIVLAAVEKYVKNRPEGKEKWPKGFQNFSNNTFALNYMLTSIGYMLAIIEGYVFWYMYIALCLLFLAALYFDFIKPFLVKLARSHVVKSRLPNHCFSSILSLVVQTVHQSYRKGDKTMDNNKRPDNMVRITTSELAETFIEEQVKEIQEQVGDKKVLLALSGGVDSSVVAALLIKAIGKQLVCVHVNHGLLRKGEPEQVVEVFRNQMDANLIYVDAIDRFLDKLEGVEEPEQKRKIIGAEFIRVFEEEARKLEGIEFLAQGTIYPDILESDGVKAHHNVGGLPEDLHFELVEPLKLLFKDEVRVVGKALGLPDGMVYRQPFPGPGLGVRCLGAITRDRLEAVRESDAILREEFAKNGLEGKVWQYFTVIPDFRSVGVKGGKRSFEWPVILRAVNTKDAMTATVEDVPFSLLQHITERITKEVPGVNRVCFDLTPKPTGTIEWE